MVTRSATVSGQVIRAARAPGGVSKDELAWRTLRNTVVSRASGRVLEIGIGDGANIEYYRPVAEEVVGVDMRDEALQNAAARSSESVVPLRLQVARAERLPFDDASFDTVVGTFVMCSVPDVAVALNEVRRLLKPGGQYRFLEHARFHNPLGGLLQDAVAPFTRRFDHGCVPNRDFETALAQSGLRTYSAQRVNMHPLLSRNIVFRPNVFGVAVREA